MIRQHSRFHPKDKMGSTMSILFEALPRVRFQHKVLFFTVHSILVSVYEIVQGSQVAWNLSGMKWKLLPSLGEGTYVTSNSSETEPDF